MSPLLRTLRAYAADAREAFRIAPVEVLLGVVVAATFSLHIRSRDVLPEESWARILVIAWLSFSPLLGLTALRLRGAISRQARVAASAGVVLSAGLYGLLVFHPQQVAEIWRVACLMMAGVLFVLLTPAIPPRVGDRRAHWYFAFGLLARALGVAAYSAVLFGALSGAVASVVNLFELREPRHLYQDLAGWLFLAAAPWILVGGVGRLLEESSRPREGAPLPVVRFGRFIYAPIVVVYLAILYSYGVKVMLTQELPKNLVSPLVLAAGLLGMVGALLLEPVHGDREQRGLSLLVRWVPALLLPLLPFAFTAILLRQGQYGWTEFRYLRLAATVMLTIVAVLGTVWLARRRMPPLASVPGILALGLLIVSVGPWSAQAVSRRDQQARLRSALAEAGVRLPLAIPAPPARGRDSITVTSAQADAIRDVIRYLGETHGMGAVAAVVGPAATRYDSSHQLFAAIPLRATCSARSWGFEATITPGAPLPITGSRVVELGPTLRSDDGGAAASGPRARVVRDGVHLRVSFEGWTAGVDLNPLIRRFAPSARAGSCRGHTSFGSGLRIPPEAARFALLDAAGTLRGELIVTQLQVHTRDEAASGAAGDALVSAVEGFILLR